MALELSCTHTPAVTTGAEESKKRRSCVELDLPKPSTCALILGVVKYLANDVTHYSKAVLNFGIMYEKNSSSQLRRVRLFASMGSGMLLSQLAAGGGWHRWAAEVIKGGRWVVLGGGGGCRRQRQRCCCCCCCCCSIVIMILRAAAAAAVAVAARST